MFRLLIDLGPIKIYSYGFMQFLAFLAGIMLAKKRASKNGITPNLIYDLSFWILIGGVAGGRLWYVIEHFDYFRANPFETVQVWHGGMVIYGGLILGFLAGFIYLKKNKIGFLKIADIVAPSITFGIFIGRIGCFLNGCCYGLQSEKIGIVFHDHSNSGLLPDAPIGIKVIPTQIFMSISALFLTIYLLLLDRRKVSQGETFCWLTIFYGIHRFSIDFLRHYEGNALVFKYITLSQFFSLILIATGITLLSFIILRNKKL